MHPSFCLQSGWMTTEWIPIFRELSMWPEPGVSFDGNCMEASVILVEAIFVAMTWPINVSLRTEEGWQFVVVVVVRPGVVSGVFQRLQAS